MKNVMVFLLCMSTCVQAAGPILGRMAQSAKHAARALRASPAYHTLVTAIRAKEERIACSLLGHGSLAAIKSSEKVLWNLLQECIQYDCINIFVCLSEMATPELLGRYDATRSTLLHYAICFNRNDIIKLLVEKMKVEDRTIRDRYGKIPLMYILEKDNPDMNIVRLLLKNTDEQTAGLLIRDFRGKTVHDYVIGKNCDRLFYYLVEQEVKKTK